MKQCLCFSFFNSNRCSFGVVSMSSGISFPLCPLYCLGDCVFALGQLLLTMGFPESSVGKESTCNAGDASLIPASGRSAEKGQATHSSILGLPLWLSFPDSLVGKESACNARDPGFISGLGRSAGEGVGYPLQYSWASRVAQLVKNLPLMQEPWVRSLGWEDPLEKGKSTHSRIFVWRIPRTVQSIGSQVRHSQATFIFTP